MHQQAGTELCQAQVKLGSACLGLHLKMAEGGGNYRGNEWFENKSELTWSSVIKVIKGVYQILCFDTWPGGWVDVQW